MIICYLRDQYYNDPDSTKRGKCLPKMKQLYIILIFWLTSCATLMNQPHTDTTVYTTGPSKIIYKKDTLNTIDNKVHLTVEGRINGLKLPDSQIV